jgi:hypothetical protein
MGNSRDKFADCGGMDSKPLAREDCMFDTDLLSFDTVAEEMNNGGWDKERAPVGGTPVKSTTNDSIGGPPAPSGKKGTGVDTNQKPSQNGNL